MKSILLILAVGGMRAEAIAKTLKVNCTGKQASIKLVGEIKSATSPIELKALEVDGALQSKAVLVNADKAYKGSGSFDLRMLWGPRNYGSIDLTLEKCNDSFEAKGQGVKKTYVGGFAGTWPSQVICNCELK